MMRCRLYIAAALYRSELNVMDSTGKEARVGIAAHRDDSWHGGEVSFQYCSEPGQSDPEHWALYPRNGSIYIGNKKAQRRGPKPWAPYARQGYIGNSPVKIVHLTRISETASTLIERASRCQTPLGWYSVPATQFKDAVHRQMKSQLALFCQACSSSCWFPPSPVAEVHARTEAFNGFTDAARKMSLAAVCSIFTAQSLGPYGISMARTPVFVTLLLLTEVNLVTKK